MPTKTTAKNIAKTPAKKITRRRTTRVDKSVLEPTTDYQPAEMVMREYKPRNSNAPMIVGLLVLIIVIGSVGSVMIWRDYFSATDDTNDSAGGYQIPLGITVDQPSADPLADWAGYESTDPAFKVRYPIDWQPDDNSTTTDEGTFIRLINTKQTDLSLEIAIQEHDGTIAAYLDELDEINAEAYEGEPAVEVANEQPVSISGQPAIIRSQKLLAADLNQVVAYVKIDDSIVSFAMTAPVVDEALASVYNQIMSTLTVATPAATTTTATTTATTTDDIEQ